MCGISVYLDPAGSRDAAHRLLKMHGEIRHRGPDGERFLAIARDGQVRLERDPGALRGTPMIAGMAFRRLNVIDVSEAASQPMASEDGVVWICFNGEIYNFRELRGKLAAAGRVFRTHSDTEVALAAYEAFGSRCFEVFDGMWAIVIADLRRRVLVASRDRFGIKPLHGAAEGGRRYLASEAKQIVAARDEKPRMNEALAAAHLRGDRLPVLDETFFSGITQIQPATFVEIALDGGSDPAPVQYWDFGAIAVRDLSAEDYPHAVDELDRTLHAAIETHSVADVNVGYLLSGGLDSSTLTAMMGLDARSNGHAPAPTFSFGFRTPEALAFSELPYAEAVAAMYGLSLYETTLDATWIAANAPRVMRALDEPAFGLPLMAQFRLFELCRQHGMTVILDGQASDEVFAGYRSYQIHLLRGYASRGNGVRFARELHQLAESEGKTSVGTLVRLILQGITRKRRSPAWIAPGFGGSDEARNHALEAAMREIAARPTPVSRRLFRDVRWGNVKIVLGYGDRVSMANSIEARVPYLDRSVVELAFSLPDEFKAGGGQRKRILRDVARRYLPPQVTERKDRMGFGTPDLLFLRGGLWTDVESRIRAIAGSRMFVPRAVDRIVEGFAQQKHDDARTIWRLYSLACWMDVFGVAV